MKRFYKYIKDYNWREMITLIDLNINNILWENMNNQKVSQ